MSSATYNNSAWSLSFALKDAVSGAVIDITDKEFEIQLRPFANSSDLLLEMSTDNGMLSVADGPAGKLAVNVSTDIAATVPPGDYVFDIREIITGGERVRVAGGTWKIGAGVTR